MTVHICHATQINISVSVSAELLAEQRDMHVQSRKYSYQQDINLLIRHLSRETAAILRTRHEVELAVESHKKQLLEFGDELVLTQQAWSDRPAFCGYLPTPLERKGLWYAYNAMGLPRQHWMQDSILSAGCSTQL